MPHQLRRASLLVRVFSACALLLLAIQVASMPASAAPAGDDDEIVAPSDELTVGSSYDSDEEAVETEDEADDESTQDEDAPAAEAADEDPDAISDVAQDEDEPAQDEDEPASADDGDAPIVEAADVEESTASAALQAVNEVRAAPARVDDVDDGYLRRLLDAINERRERNGTQRLAFVPARANSALDTYLAEKAGECDHQPIHGEFSWDFVLAAGFGGAPRGEVLACPDSGSYWTPDRTAERWWESPIHHDVLYDDGDSSSIACSASGVRGGSSEGGKKRGKSGGSPGTAYAVLCVTFRD